MVTPPRTGRSLSSKPPESYRAAYNVRSCKYLNNVIEQDHRRIKQRVRPMLGFKRFETAAVTIRGIELAEKIKKQQFNLKPLTGKAITAPEMWAAILA
jgi:transposase-like protein